MDGFPELPADRLGDFLHAIHTEPDSDEPRLVFADWLEDHGDPRAELIRLQCQLAAERDVFQNRPDLAERERAWLQRYQPIWLESNPPHRRHVVWDRGLPTIAVGGLHYFKDAPESLWHAVSQGWVSATITVRDMKRVSPDADKLLRRFLGIRTLCLCGTHGPIVVARHEVCRTLLSLDLAQTGVTDADLASVNDWSNLRRLSLRENVITHSGLQYLPSLTGLVALRLDRTFVSGAGLQHLRDLVRLRELSLRHLTDLASGLPDLSALTSLQSLDLRQTDVGNGDVRRLQTLTGLRRLLLDETAVTDTGLASLLPTLTGLRELNLAGLQITDVSLRLLSELRQLRTLDLRRTRTMGGFVDRGGLTELQRLDLSGTPITDAALENLRGLSRLRLLRIQNTNLSGLAIRKLQRCLPCLHVVH